MEGLLDRLIAEMRRGVLQMAIRSKSAGGRT